MAIAVPPVGAVNQFKVPPVQPLADNETVPVLHLLALVVLGADGSALICRSAPLSLPVTIGSDETTRILYANPVRALPGIVALMLPLEVEAKVPILKGVPKLPLASDN